MFPFKKLFIKYKESDMNENYGNIPGHIAIIMDGNGRWAKKRGLPRSAGHKQGSDNLKKIVRFCDTLGVKYLTVFAFSTENWTRPKSEVDYLMNLLLEKMKDAENELSGKNVNIRVIGNIKALSDEFQKEISRVERLTENNSGLKLIIAINYGGRDDIIYAVKKIAREVSDGRLDIDEINERAISDRLYTAGIPDPDLLIRPSGEKRISNYLLWQSAYTEFWYDNVLWPDFDERHLLQAIDEYKNRNRRYGGI